ncbi:hypothetical protein H0H93_000628, partial [Arthromyces matolae]
GFPPGEIETKGEVVILTESASTLENLFQYVYPRRHPDIELLPFLELSNLAEAAEKYEVFGVITICKTRIKHFVADHPGDIFNYAYKHGYNDILSMAAPLLLDLQFSSFAQSFPAELMNPWVSNYLLVTENNGPAQHSPSYTPSVNATTANLANQTARNK